MTASVSARLAQPFASYHDVLTHYSTTYDRYMKDGTYQPYTWPYHSLGPNLLILYLLLPPTNSKIVFNLRYPLFVIIIYLSIESTVQCRTAYMTLGYGIGLLNAWLVLWSATLIIFRDARGEFKRIEGRKMEPRTDDEKSSEQSKEHAKASGADDLAKDTHLRPRVANGSLSSPPGLSATSKKPSGATFEAKSNYYVYQTLPQGLLHRIDWVGDLVSSFRGPRWAHRISGVPPPPQDIQDFLSDPTKSPPNAASESAPPTRQSNMTRRDVLRQNLPYFLFYVLAMDALKSLTMQDPYFWSLGAAMPSPFPYKRTTRLLLSLSFTFVSLETIFLLAPLLLGGLLGPALIGEHAWPWLYSPYFGPPSAIATKGLAGTWGIWWQQLFRFGFEQAGEYLARILGKGWEKGTQRGMFVRVVTAFWASGILHLCASYTSLAESMPFNAWLFFAVQPIGLIGQRILVGWLKRMGWREKIPKWLRESGNVVFVVLWCWATGPLIADDFASTGIWLYEPVPVSLFRGLSGQGWWCWGGQWARWHNDDRWWRRGIAF